MVEGSGGLGVSCSGVSRPGCPSVVIKYVTLSPTPFEPLEPLASAGVSTLESGWSIEKGGGGVGARSVSGCRYS